MSARAGGGGLLDNDQVRGTHTLHITPGISLLVPPCNKHIVVNTTLCERGHTAKMSKPLIKAVTDSTLILPKQ